MLRPFTGALIIKRGVQAVGDHGVTEEQAGGSLSRMGQIAALGPWLARTLATSTETGLKILLSIGAWLWSE